MIKIVAVTTAGLLANEIKELDVTMIPQRVNFGMETLRDGIDISDEVFLQRLASSKDFPTTSQPPAGDFLEAFKKIRSAGHEVLAVLVSNKLSGTVGSANTAKSELNNDPAITIFDTLNVAAGEGLMVLEAARMAEAGKSVSDIVSKLEHMRDHMHLLFVLDTLEYLAKGGRIGNAQKLIGSMLQMKPILEIKHGAVEQFERVRTKAKARARLHEVVDHAVRGKSQLQMAVMYTEITFEATQVANELKEKYHLRECNAYHMSPAVGAHAGPGALGIAYYIEPHAA
jgi:fatty acid kinase fatty acid binding subunit